MNSSPVILNQDSAPNLWRPKVSLAILFCVLFNAGVYLYLCKAKYFWSALALFIVAVLFDSWFNLNSKIVLWLIMFSHAWSLCINFEPTTERSWYSRASAILFLYGSVLLSLILVRVFVLEPFRIPSSSMQPTLHRGDFILVKKMGYGTYGFLGLTLENQSVSEDIEMHRGQLYVFYPPGKKGAYVKRLIGLPGDTIELNAQHEVIVNGKPLSRSNVPYNVDRNVEETLGDITYLTRRFRNNRTRAISAFKVPEKSFYLLGDNRDNSIDSRSFGFVADDRIIGKVVLKLNGKRD